MRRRQCARRGYRGRHGDCLRDAHILVTDETVAASERPHLPALKSFIELVSSRRRGEFTAVAAARDYRTREGECRRQDSGTPDFCTAAEISPLSCSLIASVKYRSLLTPPALLYSVRLSGCLTIGAARPLGSALDHFRLSSVCAAPRYRAREEEVPRSYCLVDARRGRRKK